MKSYTSNYPVEVDNSGARYILMVLSYFGLWTFIIIAILFLLLAGTKVMISVFKLKLKVILKHKTHITEIICFFK
jgi:hypothetical protein